MNTIPSESDSNAILDRLLSGAGLHRDAQLAALLGVSPQAVSQARRKRKIPEGWVVKVSQQCGLSMDWLMFGKGDESTPVASHAPVASSTSQASTPAGAAGPELDGYFQTVEHLFIAQLAYDVQCQVFVFQPVIDQIIR